MSGATLHEILAVAVAGQLRDEDVGFTGLTTGRAAAMFGTMIPLAAMELARMTHAPSLASLLAGWCENPSLADLRSMPDLEFDPELLGLPCDARDMNFPPLYSLKRGDVTVGFSSGAQVDREGNLNTVAIGPAARPNVRLVGPILIPEHMALFGREIVMMPRHDARTFVERVDHVTGVGFPGGREGRAKLGLPGGGPHWIVTPLCIFGFDDEGLIRVESVHPGVDPDRVRAETGFEPLGLDRAPTTPLPSEAELRLLRTRVDPNGFLRGDG
jgi:glutaconate CoA-transferase, subunit B